MSALADAFAKIFRLKRMKSFANHIAEVALEEAARGVREESRNRGKRIADYWTATNYPNGMENREPWCAAFAAWVVREAAKRSGYAYSGGLPQSAAVVNWPAWAKKQPWWQRLPVTGAIQPGDIVCFDFNGTDATGGTHIGIATSAERADGTFDTVEGNTSCGGSRDGDGVYLRTSRTRAAVFAIIRAPLMLT